MVRDAALWQNTPGFSCIGTFSAQSCLITVDKVCSNPPSHLPIRLPCRTRPTRTVGTPQHRERCSLQQYRLRGVRRIRLPLRTRPIRTCKQSRKTDLLTQKSVQHLSAKMAGRRCRAASYFRQSSDDPTQRRGASHNCISASARRRYGLLPLRFEIW